MYNDNNNKRSRRALRQAEKTGPLLRRSPSNSSEIPRRTRKDRSRENYQETAPGDIYLDIEYTSIYSSIYPPTYLSI
jgi:hypothetical protein